MGQVCPICLELLLAICSLAIPALPMASVERGNTAELQRQFQSAVNLYQNKQFGAAQQILSKLLQSVPNNFQVNELLGMVCVARNEAEQATPYLAKAVRLKPDSAQARMSLAANLVELHQNPAAEREFKKAIALSPAAYDTNHNLGEFYIRTGNLPAAIPSLAKAQGARPSAYDNGYDLALAEIKTGNNAAAVENIQRLLASHNTAELRSLLATADERSGLYLEAAKEYQLAARMDPSEANLFAWGSELLLHHTLEPAVEVFQHGVELYPRSARLEMGLGIALYSRTHYTEAIDAFCRAIDLNPIDTRPYWFLGKIYDFSPLQAAAVTERFARYARLQPHNPQALYYYAMSLWKASREQSNAPSLQKAEKLLERAIALEPSFAQAHLQLGLLYAQQRRYVEAIGQYRQAIRLQPDLANAHYHLGEALVRTGRRAAGRHEFETFNRLHESQVKEREEQRKKILQFVYTASPPAGGKFSARQNAPN